MGRRRLGLSRVRLQAQPRRLRPPLRPPPAGLSDKRAGSAGHALHRQLGRLGPTVLPRAGDVRAPFAVHARAALPAHVSRPHGARTAQLRRDADTCSEVAGRPPAAKPGTDPVHQPCVPPTRAGRPVGRRDDHPDRGRVAGQRDAGRHLHRVQLRQRPAHRRVSADAGQADSVRHGYPRAAGRRRTRGAGWRDQRRDGRKRRSRQDVRGDRGHAHAERRPQPDAAAARRGPARLARCDPGRAPRSRHGPRRPGHPEQP